VTINRYKAPIGKMKPTGCDRPGRPRRSLSPCSEQGKLPAAKAFKLAERDKHMSEQEKPKSFMQELDQWTQATVIKPLHEAITEGDGAECDATSEEVKRAIRLKVLESYRNGQAAGPKARKEQKYDQAKTR
jgi:hypothetical protein